MRLQRRERLCRAIDRMTSTGSRSKPESVEVDAAAVWQVAVSYGGREHRRRLVTGVSMLRWGRPTQVSEQRLDASVDVNGARKNRGLEY